MKKLFSLVLVLVMSLGMVTIATAADYKIGFLTGTVTQNEEEFRAGERQLAMYPDGVLLDTYPDKFMDEMETTVSKLQKFADDPMVKGIVMAQAVPGCLTGFEKIRELRDDVLLIASVPQEDPAKIASAADLCLYANELKQGDTIMELCDNWGVDVFIHYSFPRHMAMETIVARHEVLTRNAEILGIEFYDVTAPDPTAEAGTSASQQFILEDVPQQMAKFEGKKVAFFTTNCGMQPALQTAVLDQPNAYYPQPCCPSPYHGFPSTLGLEIEMGGDDHEALVAIAAALKEHDAVGRFSTWPKPMNMVLVDVAASYIREYQAGTITSRNDSEAVKRLFEEAAPSCVVEQYTNVEGETLDNYYVVYLPPVDFNDYL